MTPKEPQLGTLKIAYREFANNIYHEQTPTGQSAAAIEAQWPQWRRTT